MSTVWPAILALAIAVGSALMFTWTGDKPWSWLVSGAIGLFGYLFGYWAGARETRRDTHRR